MLKVWGRRDGSNVIKALWCLGEIGIEYERIDWGGAFGGNDEPEYRAKNPNGKLPTLEYDDGYTLWESGAVVRFLCAEHSLGDLCPADNRARAAADKWMDWSSINFAGFNGVLLAQYFMLPEEKRTPGAVDAALALYTPMLDILEKHL
ncbi:MAG: glutathione S-transferase, partial [Alphaproteobacteria bacterium]